MTHFRTPIFPGCHQHAYAADELHVLTMISNPVGNKRRYELYPQFAKRITDAGATLWTVEIATGHLPHAVTSPDNPHHLQLRTSVELWHKENALNLLVQRLPPTASKIAWIDADTAFSNPDWVEATLRALDHYAVVQMFSECMDLAPDSSVVPADRGGEHFPGVIYKRLAVESGNPGPYSKFGHCGYAWAIRRDALDAVGGLLDLDICGANDWHMANGFLGNIHVGVHGESSPEFKSCMRVWGQRALMLRQNVGYIPGLLTHYWHGSKKNRQYQSRWRLMIDSQFDPVRDIKRDWQGLYQLHDDGSERMRKLRDGIRAYFRSRNEDSIDL